MGKLKYIDVKNEIESYGWKLISLEYKKLDEELILECSEGHRVYISFKKFRRTQICPVCANNPLKDLDTKVIPKKGKKRILALDQATKISGFSIFDDNELVKYGVFESSLEHIPTRIHAQNQWLINMIANWQPDLIGLEDIQLQEKSGKQDSSNVVGIQTFKMLAQLQGVLINLLIDLDIDYQVAYPATWRSHCGVKGKTKTDRKRSAQLIVKDKYDISVTDDEADAICLGKYFSEIFSRQNEIVDWE